MQGAVLDEVEALQRLTHDAQKRATLALGLLNCPNEAAKALGRKSCDHPDLRRDAMCTESTSPLRLRAGHAVVGATIDR